MKGTIWRAKRSIWAYALFLLAIGALILVRDALARTATLSIPDAVGDAVTLGVSVIVEATPFLILGVVLSVVVQVWVPTRWTVALAAHPRAWIRRLGLSVLGVFLPVCECGNVPLGRGLMRRGVRPADGLTFLLAAPILNPVTIITTQQAFPGDNRIVIARIVAGLLISNCIGWLYSKQKDQTVLLQTNFAASCKVEAHSHGKSGSKTNAAAEMFVSEFKLLLPALFLGASLAAMIQTMVPRDILLNLGSSPVWSMLGMLGLAFVVSICSNVDAFFALAFSSTFSAGAIVVFLVFGPMIDIKMLMLLRTLFKKRVLLEVTGLVALMSLCAGLVVHHVF